MWTPQRRSRLLAGAISSATVVNVSRETRREEERWQIATSSYVREVLEVARASPKHTSARFDHANRELVIVGVGEPAEELAKVMRRSPENIRVIWQEAPYTLDELSAEARRILAAHPGRLHGAGPTHDGTGIRLRTNDAELLSADDPQAALGARYPVTIEYGGPVVPA